METSSKDSGAGSTGGAGQNIGRSEPTEMMNRSEIAQKMRSGGKDDCYLMLAQVNLLRVRKQIDPAIELCKEVVTTWPLRPDAHALLGDLHQENGQIDDAILRYCRVLELDPKSKLNRQKLSDMVKAKRAQLGQPASQLPITNVLRLDRFVRAVVLALATLMLVTIMLTPVVFEHRKSEQALTTDGTTIDRRINLNPILIQPLEPEPTTSASTSSAQTTVAIVRDPAEQALVDLMSSDKSLLDQGIQVMDAQEDPINNGFSITFLDRPSAGNTLGKSDILRSSMIVASSASDRFGSRDVHQFTIRCLLLTSSTSDSSSNTPIEGTTSLEFVGTIQRSAVSGDTGSLDSQTPDQLAAVFTDSWWASGIN